jgi:cytochrome c2
MKSSFVRARAWYPVSVLMAIMVGFGAVAVQAAEAPADEFKKLCISCHTIGGGRIVGPDLKNVVERQDRAWLVRFITDPQSVLASGDAYAMKLKEEARGVVMPTVPGMTADRAMALLDMIVDESALEKSRFAGVQVSDRPFTAADIAQGRELFLGIRPLVNGGASCVSCHSVNGIGVLAGGGLGPDLNQVFERLNGRKGLVTWLSAPATTTMGAVFGPHPLEADAEILPLVAYFADLAEDPRESSQAATLIFVLLGIAGTAAVLMTFDGVWKGRFRGVREEMVMDSAERVRGSRNG